MPRPGVYRIKLFMSLINPRLKGAPPGQASALLADISIKKDNLM